jgi:hypothetical protein
LIPRINPGACTTFEIFGHNDLMDVAGDRYAATLRKFAKLVDEFS